MMDSEAPAPSCSTVSRRAFLELTARSLLLAVAIPACRGRSGSRKRPRDAAALAPSVFVELTEAGLVRIWITKSEMGQGVHTALPMMLADELDADWSAVEVVQADVDDRFGPQHTGGSMSVAELWGPLRLAGAQARAMLVAAAAKQWGVPAETCRTEASTVIHPPTGQRLSYAQLVPEASAMPVPQHPRLKEAKDFRMIGRSVPRTDAGPKLVGKAIYGLDVRVPGMVFAVVSRSPVFGGRLKGFNASTATAIDGVLEVVPLENAVAVVARTTWAAMRGREALRMEWQSPVELIDSPSLSRRLAVLAGSPGRVARNDGNVDLLKRQARHVVQQDYELPFLAHATMEPMNCTARAEDGRCEIWAPTQAPTALVEAVGQALALPRNTITVHVTFLGGGFGRRLLNDYAVEAARVSRAVGRPVQLLWTREDDISGGWYRPCSLHRMAGGLDRRGRISFWSHRIITPSITGELPSGKPEDAFSPFATAGFASLAYDIPNLRVEYRSIDLPVPVCWWRSVYASQYAFANEVFVDELAARAGADPVRFRRGVLSAAPRLRHALDVAAERAGWSAPLRPHQGRGVAINEFFGTHVAQVAEVSFEGGAMRIDRITCAVDCGTAVHPGQIEAQIAGGILDGLSATLWSAITLRHGAAVERNFDSYRLLGINEVPRVDVHVIPSQEPPTGVGEPGVPPVAPAVVNAVFAATSVRHRKLPLRLPLAPRH